MSPPAAPDRFARRLERAIADDRVVEAMLSVPRDRFVAPELVHAAWRNRPLPIGSGQTISQPLLVARMCELLTLGGGERVLDVGGGSGYHAAVLSRLAHWVWSIERREELVAVALSNLAAAGIDNVTMLVGDAADGYAAQAPYDAINVAAAAPELAALAPLEQQLTVGGRLIAPVGGERQQLVLVQRTAVGLRYAAVAAVRFVPLV
jgi:protein-L-isoaspartate(D-aspartate) O-methyltransferase